MSVKDVGTIESFGFDKDPIVIRKYVAGVKGGKVLNVDDFEEEYIKAGHVVVYDATNDEYKPMPVSDGKYGALPSGCVYAGVVVATKAVAEPFVSIMHTGVVNDVASPYALDTIMEALKAAVPTLVFEHD